MKDNVLKLIKEQKWEELNACISDNIIEIKTDLFLTKNKIVLFDVELYDLSGGTLERLIPLNKINEDYITLALFGEDVLPSILKGKYSTVSRKLELYNEQNLVERIKLTFDQTIKQFESLGIMVTKDVILKKTKLNQYTVFEENEVSPKPDSVILSDYLDNKCIFYFDCETTGLESTSEQMLELYGKLTKNGNFIDHVSITFLVDEGRTINPEALKVNQIKPFSDDWKNSSLSQKDAAIKIRSFFQKYIPTEKVVFCAYNANFDLSFFNALLKKAGISELHFDGVFDPLALARKLTDSKKFTTKLKDNGKMCNKLSSVADGLGVKASGDFHRASTDVDVLEQVVNKLLEKA